MQRIWDKYEKRLEKTSHFSRMGYDTFEDACKNIMIS